MFGIGVRCVDVARGDRTCGASSEDKDVYSECREEWSGVREVNGRGCECTRRTSSAGCVVVEE